MSDEEKVLKELFGQDATPTEFEVSPEGVLVVKKQGAYVPSGAVMDLGPREDIPGVYIPDPNDPLELPWITFDDDFSERAFYGNCYNMVHGDARKRI